MYLKYRSGMQSGVKSQAQKIVANYHGPIAMHMRTFDRQPVTKKTTIATAKPTVVPDATTTKRFDSEEVTIQDLEERLIPDQVTEAIATESSTRRIDTLMNQTTSTPGFVSVKNQWSLEQPPSARQLLQAVKQFFQQFQYFKNGRHETEKIR